MGSAYQSVEKQQTNVAGIADAGGVVAKGNGGGLAAEIRREGQTGHFAQNAHQRFKEGMDWLMKWGTFGLGSATNDLSYDADD